MSVAIIGKTPGGTSLSLIPRNRKHGDENGCIPREREMSSHPIFTSRFEIVDESRIVIVSMTGDLDPRAVEDLHPQIQELVRAGYRRFVLDLSALITSAASRYGSSSPWQSR
jgi:hypothetical protein